MPVITAIEPQKNRADRVNVYVDGEFAVGLNAAVAVSRRLQTGATLTEDEIASLKFDDELETAHSASLNFLSYRPRSSREVRQYLRRKLVSAEVADSVLDRLHGAGLVNDAEFARFWVDNRQQFRPRSRRALEMEMRSKGVDREDIAEVLEDLPEEQITALQLARKRAPSLRATTREEFERKMQMFLQRRGFGWDVALRAARDCYEELTEAD